MPASLLDLLEGVVELLDLFWDMITRWRFWIPILISVLLTVLIVEIVHDPMMHWLLGGLVMVAGIAIGLVWHWKGD